jgi:hypothetical protein
MEPSCSKVAPQPRFPSGYAAREVNPVLDILQYGIISANQVSRILNSKGMRAPGLFGGEKIPLSHESPSDRITMEFVGVRNIRGQVV